MTFWTYFWIFVPPIALVVIGVIYYLVSTPDEWTGDAP
jgi:hypothetical protein